MHDLGAFDFLMASCHKGLECRNRNAWIEDHSNSDHQICLMLCRRWAFKHGSSAGRPHADASFQTLLLHLQDGAPDAKFGGCDFIKIAGSSVVADQLLHNAALIPAGAAPSH